MLHRHGVHDRPSADAKASRCSAAGALVHTGAAATEAPVRAAAAAVPLRASPHRKTGEKLYTSNFDLEMFSAARFIPTRRSSDSIASGCVPGGTAKFPRTSSKIRREVFLNAVEHNLAITVGG